uniref:Uncharacterized protein n=1 Tax=Anopheles maculatus TaxID=74869 RepID=A0A182SRT9_9DIPT
MVLTSFEWKSILKNTGRLVIHLHRTLVGVGRCDRRRTAFRTVSTILIDDGWRWRPWFYRIRTASFNDKLLRFLPRETGATEVTVRAGTLVERGAQLQILHYFARAQIKVVRNNLQQFLLVVLGRAVVEHRN